MMKRNVVFSLAGFAGLEPKPSDDHARDPEEDDVRRSYEHTGWIKFVSRLLVHRLIRPEPGRKPGVERVFILNPILGIRRRFDADVNFRFQICNLRISVSSLLPMTTLN